MGSTMVSGGRGSSCTLMVRDVCGAVRAGQRRPYCIVCAQRLLHSVRSACTTMYGILGTQPPMRPLPFLIVPFLSLPAPWHLGLHLAFTSLRNSLDEHSFFFPSFPKPHRPLSVFSTRLHRRTMSYCVVDASENAGSSDMASWAWPGTSGCRKKGPAGFNDVVWIPAGLGILSIDSLRANAVRVVFFYSTMRL